MSQLILPPDRTPPKVYQPLELESESDKVAVAIAIQKIHDIISPGCGIVLPEHQNKEKTHGQLELLSYFAYALMGEKFAFQQLC